ncbi:SDR family oxidoreductase [Legionella impletisoli]|uniref:Gluconate 5-dehydrogenase n=1 Tax=Legionella impletisoli TaxID=343510 RepID=A0A917NA60_9GAMM|nr:SDR family oxidoreductase [Legionella impletisoli]GGI82159.1 gluconate 5-dehydrogenase [Legionella impletisoli]
MMEHPTVFLTGATGKLGKNIALGFASLGCQLILPIRSEQTGYELAMKCKQAGSKEVHLIQVDLTEDNSADKIQTWLNDHEIFPNILVNNARNLNYLRNDKGIVSRENWKGEMLLDVIIPYELTMLLAQLPGSTLKKVINISSIYGITVPNLKLYDNPDSDSSINYGVAKAALIHLTKELAVRLASKEIEVNSISFGGVEGRVKEDFLTKYKNLCPAEKMLSEDQIFGTVKFLAFNDSNGMTGHNLVMDGGWTVW